MHYHIGFLKPHFDTHNFLSLSFKDYNMKLMPWFINPLN